MGSSGYLYMITNILDIPWIMLYPPMPDFEGKHHENLTVHPQFQNHGKEPEKKQ